jgi:hypothetical protein
MAELGGLDDERRDSFARLDMVRRSRVIHTASPPLVSQRANMFSFRMISDTRIECQNANSQGETTRFGSARSNRGGTQPRSAGALGVDGFLPTDEERGP